LIGNTMAARSKIKKDREKFVNKALDNYVCINEMMQSGVHKG